MILITDLEVNNMIKLWKGENKNKQLREIIAKERVTNHSYQWKYCSREEKAMDISRWYNCSYAMAEKVVWILCGDCTRQIEICNTLGKEYALYVPTGCQ